MNISLLLRTVRHLRGQQIVYQVWNRLYHARYRNLSCKQEAGGLRLMACIDKPMCLKNGNSFTFLNITDAFHSWNETSHGMLWAYNLNYMDWLMQDGMTYEEGAKWIKHFIDQLPENNVGLDSYPIALRGINWVKFITLHSDMIKESERQVWNDSLYSQYMLLTRKLEYRLLGNHLLEDAYSIFMGAIYFGDDALYKKAARLLRKELEEQILPDGAHYEQSPMYHCILLDRLLDCCNFSFNNVRFDGQEAFNIFLRKKAVLMLGHLDSIVYQDGTIPLLNDSAKGIAPTPAQLWKYARRLGLAWERMPLKECGYRKLVNKRMEAVVDMGNITASYQPGHTHADTFNYELKIDGMPFIVDTGISTYNKTSRRQYERGTSAHNTVSVDGRNSSEVWGGFRVGSRAKVWIRCDMESAMEASHDGFGGKCLHTRKVQITDTAFVITDSVSQQAHAVSYIHFAPDVRVLSYNEREIVTDRARICIEGAESVSMADGTVSDEYNIFLPTKIASVHFSRKMTYFISI